MKIVFATNNQHKLEEIRQILGSGFEVLSLNDINCHDDIPETGKTLEENARMKAEYVWKHHLSHAETPIFADDTGLEVDALGGEPGIFSARYAALDGDGSESHNSEANMRKLLRKLGNNNNRKARFRTVIALIEKGVGSQESGVRSRGVTLFEGIVNGHIAHEKSGSEGFGYDPIFIPDGYNQSFAELGAEVKNKISHRARAIEKLADFLKGEKVKR